MTADGSRAVFEVTLAQAGIAMPAEWMDDALAEWLDLREHIARVVAACPEGAEPATIFRSRP